MPSRVKSELDLIGYDGERLAIIGSAYPFGCERGTRPVGDEHLEREA